MRTAPKPLLALLLAALIVGSCVGGDDPTGPSAGEVGIALQPALIPSPADQAALPINRIHAVVSRYPDGAVLRTQRFDVSPTAPSWAIDVNVPVVTESVQVVVYLFLLHVDGSGVESVQFSGRTEPMSVSIGTRLEAVDADVVRGPLSNLLVTGVTITSAPDTVYIGYDVALRAVAETEGTAPEIFWTSLDPSVLTMADSVAVGLTPGTARIVASAGAHADTVSVEVVAASVDSILVLPDSADVVVGQSRAYTALLLDANGEPTFGPVSWSTGNTSIATVNANGQVTGVAPGTTKVRATSGDVFGEAVVRIVSAPTGGSRNVWQGSDGNWSDASKWSLGRVPAAGDTVEISQGVDYVVTLDVNASVGVLRITAPAMLSITDADLTLTARGEGPELEVGPASGLMLVDGSVVGGDVVIDGMLVASGISFLDADSIENHGQWFFEGGQLHLSNDGVVLETDGLIDLGANSYLYLGADGEMRYRGGELAGTGSVVFGNRTSLRLYEDLTLDGWLLGISNGSILAESGEALLLGPSASVTLSSTVPTEVQAGRLVVDGSLVIGGADVRIAGPLEIGESGGASFYDAGRPMTITTGDVKNAGQILFIGSGSIRFGPGAAGSIVIESGGYLTTSGGTAVVLDGQLENAGTVILGGPTELRREDANGNPVTAQHRNEANAALELWLDGKLDVYLGGVEPSAFTNAGAVFLYNNARLYFENLSNPPSQIVAEATASFEGVGEIDLTGGVVDLTGVNDGTIRPGLFGPGVMTWTGTLPMGPSSVLEIDIFGPEPGSRFDQLNVSSQLVLNGNGELTVNWLDYTPFAGDRFPILTYGQRAGDFGAVELNPPSGVALDLQTVVTQDPTVPDTLVVVVTQGPSPVAADWTFDIAEGQFVPDDSGEGNHGTLGTDPQQQDAADPTFIGDARIGAAMSFSGAQVVHVPDAPSLEPLALTVEGFVRGTGPGANVYLLAKGGGPTSQDNAAYALYTGFNGGLAFYTTLNGSTTFYASEHIDPAAIWDGEWHHVAGTFDGSRVAIWLDGTQVGAANPAILGYFTPSQDLSIGALHPSGAFGFTGDIDELRIWRRALTAGEIQARATRGAP